MRLICLILGCMALDVWSANQVVWHPKARAFDLRVKDVPLEVFLGMIKAETGWEVKVEPGLQRVVSGKFRDKPAADAIRLMLGRVRFALLPRVGRGDASVGVCRQHTGGNSSGGGCGAGGVGRWKS